VTSTAVGKGQDPAQAIRAAIATMLACVGDPESDALLWEPLDQVYMTAWSNSSMRLSDAIMDLFGAHGEGEEDARKQWTDNLEKYWRNAKSHAVRVAEATPTDSDDPIDQFQRTMPNKLEWISLRILFPEFHPFVKELPIINPYMISGLQRLFYSESKKKLNLESIVVAVRPSRRLGEHRMTVSHDRSAAGSSHSSG
jgi:hypothetical protein